MKLSSAWLREWVDPPLTDVALCERLTMAGLELESLAPVAPEFSGVVVAAVRATAAHPDADRLTVCTVDDGSGVPRQVVCGARNVRPGLHVPLALPGAVLPDGTQIRDASLRGVASSGMLCSARELGLEIAGEGLLELDAAAPPGADVRSWLALDDAVIELNVTPNRGDCLSVRGIAREVSAITGAPLRAAVAPDVPATIDAAWPVVLEAGRACTHYAARVVRGIDPQRPTPAWLRRRLERSGVRSLGLVVDITNYVMLELGQPMHAFDLARLEGPIRVRWSRPGEILRLLDQQQLTLDGDSLIIADDRGPLALAGIMGGAESAVGATTVDILLESAWFDPVTIAGRARSYRLTTDSSHRFERSVDTDLQVVASKRAGQLLAALGGSRLGPVTLTGTVPRASSPILLPKARVARVLGVDVAADEVRAIFERLGLTVSEADGSWRVVPPSWRSDLHIAADLIEEVARVHGYDRIPATTPGGRLRVRTAVSAPTPAARARRRLVERGYAEAVTFSFVDADWQRHLDPECPPVALQNPIAADLSVMRTTLWPGLLHALNQNLARQQRRVRLFEVGMVFRNAGGELVQPVHVAGVACGAAHEEQWGLTARPVDFFDLKADVEALLALAGGQLHGGAAAGARHPALHPGQCLALDFGLRGRGWLGALHPGLAESLGIEVPVYVFELPLDVLAPDAAPVFSPLSRFPSTRRDLSIVVAQDVTAASVLESVRASAGPFLRDLQLFDVYEGERIDKGKKSFALGLIFQGSSSTLVDDVVNAAVQGVVESLQRALGATLRD